MTITTWNMHDLCGANLDIQQDAGEIILDTDELPVNLAGNTCRLTLRAASTQYTKYMVMFYFTQFKFYDLCGDANITFIDGASITDRVISGLPSTLCGINSTLEHSGVYFTSSGGYLKLIFNKHQTKFRNLFTIKFISYHLGTCDTETMYECSNGNCIPNEYACIEEIDSCGITDTDCMLGNSTTPIPIEPVVASIVGTITSLIFLCVIVVPIFCCIRMFKSNSHRECLDCLEQPCRCCCEGFGRCVRKCCDGIQYIGGQCSKCAHGLATRVEEIRQRSNTNDVTSQTRSEETNQQSFSNFELSATNNSAAYGAEADSPDNNRYMTPSAPPPEYTSIVDAPPSYEDVISKEGRVKTEYMA
ncbi:hypothetical protein ACF0H5_010386 [Mactra antiquata]